MNIFSKQACHYTCRRCFVEFYSNNKLHKHVRGCKITSSKSAFDVTKQDVNVFHVAVVQFDVASDSHSGLGFRSWRYVIIEAFIYESESSKSDVQQTSSFLHKFCIDTDCGVFLVDRQFLVEVISDYERHMRQKVDAIKVRGIGDFTLISKDYLSISFRVSGTSINEKSVIVSFIRHVYVVNDLKIKMLMGNDIFDSKKMTIDLKNQKIIIESCKHITTSLEVVNRDSSVKRIARASNVTKISVNSVTMMSFKFRGKFNLSSGRDFMFVSQRVERLGIEDGIMFYIVDVYIVVVQVRNASFKDVFLFKSIRLGIVQEYEEKECYLAAVEDVHLTANSGSHKSAPRNWLKIVMKIGVVMIVAGVVVFGAYHGIEVEFSNTSATSVNSAFASLEQIIFNDIIIYGETSVVRTQIVDVVVMYSNIWHDDGIIVRVSSEEWMSIDIQSDAKIEVVKVYSLSSVDRKIVDEIFDKFHAQERMEYTTQSTSHGYSVFVVWRTVIGFDGSERKERAVIDIRGFNKIVIIDSYFMSLQSDIISAVVDCKYISVFDVVGFFYQWLVRIADRHKLIVVSHRGQKQFNVAVMSFKNSSIYVQRKIDVILRVYREFAKAYVDDIVVFSHTLKKHLAHLHIIFQLMNSFGISLSSKKSFLDYFTIALLNQKIDVFGLIIVVEKLEVIVKLNFFYILKNLKIYLDLIDWFRDFVVFYAQKADALQQRKISLLRQSSFNKNFKRKIFFRQAIIENSIVEEFESYRQLQEVFVQVSFLVHFVVIRQLYIDIDVFKRRGFETIVYHLKISCLNSAKSKRIDIEFILFLSRMFNVVEIRYWSTELEMCGLMWVVRRVRHMMKISTSFTIVYIDHVVNTSIARQITLNSVNTNKLNLRLMRASIYLSQFRLDVRHRSDKEHVISDALSRLFFDSGQISQQFSFEDILDFDTFHDGIVDSSADHDVYVFQKSLVIMSDEFRKQIIDDYIKKKIWRNMIEMFKALVKRVQVEEENNAKQKVVVVVVEKVFVFSEVIVFSNVVVAVDVVVFSSVVVVGSKSVDQQRFSIVESEVDEFISKKLRIGINFQLISDEIIYHLEADASRSCIFKSIEKEVFQLAHDENQHAEIHRSYERISSILYISRLSRKLRRYIEHCFSCQLTQIKRHRSYDELMSINSSSHFFYIIIMNFVVDLSEELNAILNVTCKFFRRVMIIVDKTIYSVSQWAHLLFERLLIVDWNISVIMIFDRDSKFLSDMWRIFFQLMNTKLFIFTAYHSQIDDFFERTNQIVKIIIRFLITNYSNFNFILVLSALQTQMNNVLNATIDLSANEINYDFKIRDTLFNFFVTSVVVNLSVQRLKYRQEVVDATTFVNVKVKIYYDARHTSFLFKAEDYAYFRLHHEYQLSSRLNKKIFQQRCGFFLVKKKVDRLTYELNLSSVWRVHFVIFIAQLKSVSVDEDFYQRLRFSHSKSVKMKGDTSQYKFYEIEKLIVKRIRKYNKINVTQYLMRWLKYDLEYDEWRSLKTFNNSLKLMKQYEVNHSDTNRSIVARRRERFKKND